MFNDENEILYYEGSSAYIEGYTLSGWYCSNGSKKVDINKDDYLTEKVATIFDDETISVYGNYSINSYLLKFCDESGQEVLNISAEYGSNI